MTTRKHLPKSIKYLFSIVVWLLIWQIAARKIGMELFLPAPQKVLEVLWTQLLVSGEFWNSIGFSLIQIGSGFLMGTIAGILLAVLSYVLESVEIFIWFPLKTIQSIPVASFVILVLLWIPASGLSIIIPFLMVLPILYTHTLTALKETDKKLLEMAQLFQIKKRKKIRFIYIPAILPHVLSACSLAMGLAWKSGIAAEIIGLVQGSIGNQLYQAKIYLMTPELFAWTLVIIFLSMGCEQVMRLLTHLVLKRSEVVRK